MKSIFAKLILIFLISMNGCCNKSFIYKASYTLNKIKIDGKLNEKEWKKAKTLYFAPIKQYSLYETGFVKIMFNNKYFFIGAKLNDSDIVQESCKNGTKFYKTGDVVEIFLKPLESSGYWEIYATPNSCKSTFFYPSKGRFQLPSCFNYRLKDLRVKSFISGKLNDYKKRDKYWSIEIAIPRNELNKYDVKNKWIMNIARYNYSFYLNEKELSHTGRKNAKNFHDFSSWIRINFSNNYNKQKKRQNNEKAFINHLQLER